MCQHHVIGKSCDNDITFAKLISQSHIHIIQILCASANGDNFGLFYYSKL